MIRYSETRISYKKAISLEGSRNGIQFICSLRNAAQASTANFHTLALTAIETENCLDTAGDYCWKRSSSKQNPSSKSTKVDYWYGWDTGLTSLNLKKWVLTGYHKGSPTGRQGH